MHTHIYQVIPIIGPFVSVYAINASSAPMFVLSDTAAEYFAPMILKNPFHEARVQELKEAAHEKSAEERGVYWTICLKAMVNFINHSRCIQIVLNVFEMFFMAGILLMEPFPWLIASFIIHIPIMFIQCLVILITLGKCKNTTNTSTLTCISTHHDIYTYIPVHIHIHILYTHTYILMHTHINTHTYILIHA